MKTTTNTLQDLLAQKTGEYDKFPGLLLGLDGWILRSIPIAFRKKFLEGYEKLLRIVFHPDRYPDEVAKISRQRYLQAVGEAVDFMTHDEFSFELASEAVPTKRNPMVTLRQAVESRDIIIENLGFDIEENREQASASTQALHAMRDKVNSIIDKHAKDMRREQCLRRVLTKLSRTIPVPITCGAHGVTGSFVDTDKIPRDFTTLPDGTTDNGSLFSRIHFYTQDKDVYCGDSTWFSTGKYLESFAPYLVDETKMQFKRVSSRSGYTIVGAMTLAHMCEFIRDHRDTRTKDWLSGALVRLLNQQTIQPFTTDKWQWRSEIGDYLVPFYGPGSFLILSPRKEIYDDVESEVTDDLRLFLVKDSDFSRAPDEAIVSGLKADTTNVLEDMRNLKDRYRKRLGLRNDEIYKQKLRIKHQERLIDDLRKQVEFLKIKHKKIAVVAA